MKRHILFLILGLLVFALLLFGLRSLDDRIAMPLLASGQTGEPGADGNIPQPGEDPPKEPQQDPAQGTPADAGDDQAAAVDAQIERIGTPITLDSKADIEAARAAYDALSAQAKAKVAAYPALEAAEAALAQLDAAPDGVDNTDTNDAPGTTEPGTQATEGTTGSYTPGENVVFIGGNVYASSAADTAARVTEGESACTVTYFVEDAAHPYHLISQDGGGVYGWVDASSVKKG